mgnify:CR=1 FL=1
MSTITFPYLSLLTWLPALGAVLLLFVNTDKLAKNVSLVVSLVTFLVSLFILQGFDASNVGYQFYEEKMWISSFGVRYALGVDGISLPLVILTTFLMPIIVLASESVHKSLKGYLASMLILESAMLGTFLAVDAFLFYVFWELMLAPMYFIIGIWGGKRRIYATIKFVLYTVFGSVLMFVALFYVVWSYYNQSGTSVPSFLIQDLLSVRLSSKESIWLFAAMFLAFGIKIPLFPFHTWLPDAHVEAPTGGSVVLAGVLLKMGLYGLIRLAYPLFPSGAEFFTPIMALLAVIGIVYGALVAWVQTDIKKLVAYSSVSHLGYCVLGLVAMNEISVTGSIYQMLNHGISTGALFLLVGVLYDRKHTRLIADYKGLANKVPLFAFLFLVFTLSSIALPLTNGFIGEFLILSGSFLTFPGLTMIAVSGVILGAVYMLTLYMKTIFGELNEDKNGDLTDVNRRELVIFAPLFILVFVMGIYPQPILNLMKPSVQAFVTKVNNNSFADIDTSQDEYSETRPSPLELDGQIDKADNNHG